MRSFSCAHKCGTDKHAAVAKLLTRLSVCGAAMSQTELVAMLRSRARKSGTQTSHYRGVSLLKQTQKWHAQINVGGKQVLTSLHVRERVEMQSACCVAS